MPIFDITALAKLAAQGGVKRTQMARSGRNAKGDNIKKQLDAAGRAHMTSTEAMPFARGTSKPIKWNKQSNDSQGPDRTAG